MKLKKANPSDEEGVSFTSTSTSSGFTTREKQVGETFYWVIIVVGIYFVFSLAWTIADYIQPNGKFQAFAQLSGGLELMIIGALLFGFFSLFILFTVMYNRGAMAITRSIYSAEKLYRQIRATKGPRVLTALLMISILVIAGGVVWLIYDSYSANSTNVGSGIGTKVVGFLADASTSLGEKFLFFAIIAAVAITLIVFFAWLWNKGTIFFQEKLFLKNKKEED
jgi:cell division protein FtsL